MLVSCNTTSSDGGSGSSSSVGVVGDGMGNATVLVVVVLLVWAWKRVASTGPRLDDTPFVGHVVCSLLMNYWCVLLLPSVYYYQSTTTTTGHSAATIPTLLLLLPLAECGWMDVRAWRRLAWTGSWLDDTPFVGHVYCCGFTSSIIYNCSLRVSVLHLVAYMHPKTKTFWCSRRYLI